MAFFNENRVSVEQHLKLYPLDNNEFIGTISIPENQNLEAEVKASAIETVIILDRSGSMGDLARRVTNEVLPLFLSKLSYDSLYQVYLIIESNIYIFRMTGEQMKTVAITGSGGTLMAQAVRHCHWLFEFFDSRRPVRILTISDGEISDRPETDLASTQFVNFLKTKNFTINSQAVRLFSFSSQPDTSALCSLLQINNSTTSQLADIFEFESNDLMASKMANLFNSDNLLSGQSLTTDMKVIFKFPWQSAPTSQLTLVPGENLFWFKESPPMDIKIGEVPVKIEMQAPLTLFKFQALIEGKLFYIVDHMKILKVVGSKEANRTVEKIVEYFQQKEDSLAAKSPLVKYLNINSIHRKKISNFLSDIAKDNNVKDLNSAQKAEYLRKIGYIKENPSWAEQVSRNFFDDTRKPQGHQGLILIFLVLLLSIIMNKMFS